MVRAAKLLIVEDDEALRTGLELEFQHQGYVVDSCANGKDALELALRKDYDLLLLDAMLPGLGGFEICKQLKSERPTLGIILLTARSSNIEVAEGLSRGADDYVKKPFCLTELSLRVKAVLRRTIPQCSAAAKISLRSGFMIDQENVCLISPTGTQSALTKRELELLLYLAGQNGRTISKHELLKEVWGFARPERCDTRTVDVHLAKIRKLLPPPAKEDIETVRGIGIRLHTQKQALAA